MVQRNFSELLNMNTSEYKLYHESLMQNNHGSTALHTFLCIFFSIQCSLYCSIGRRRPAPRQYVHEYIIIVLPLIAAHTVLANYIPLLTVIVSVLLLYKCLQNYHNIGNVRSLRKLNNFASRIHSVTIVRALTYLITVFCILAVDFHCFPRHLAKTERYGYSLMDTGVGLFVLISGIVHKDLRKDNLSAIVKGNAKFITILVCLGVARFWSVKQLDYQEHVTEYGVHWNFFFTLAVCKLIATALLYWSHRALLFSVLTLLLHELLLWGGLQAWALGAAPRASLLAANREGLSSCLGYVSMYLFAAHFKTEINNRHVTRLRIFCKMLLGSVFLCTCSVVVNHYRPTSRTLANAGYCLFLETTFLSIATFLYFIEVLFQATENKGHFDVPLTLSAVNRSGLLYFLIANLMTGVINLSVRTLLVSTSVAIIIFILYMSLSLTLSIYFLNKGIKL